MGFATSSATTSPPRLRGRDREGEQHSPIFVLPPPHPFPASGGGSRPSSRPRQCLSHRHISYPPAHEDVLVKLRPILVFADVIRPVGEIEPLELGTGARFSCVSPRRVVAELLVEHLSFF